MAEVDAAKLQKDLDAANAKIKVLTTEKEGLEKQTKNLSAELDLAKIQVTQLEADKKRLEEENAQLDELIKEAATEAKIIAVTDPIVLHDGKQYRAKKKAFWLPGENLPIRLEDLTDAQKELLIEKESLELL